MDYLTLSNRASAGEIAEGEPISARGKNVLVIGGGDTGSDCVGTANRQGARSVHQFEILPRPPEWKETWNPSWPLWPNILRTSSSQEEGCARDWAVATVRFDGVGGRVTRGHFVRVEWKGQESEEVRGSAFSREVDLVLLAMGFLHVTQGRLLQDLGVAFDNRGNILCGPDYATSVPGVFAAGDSVTGASLVVRSIFHGRQAAASIDRFLRG
jgi:glutamate synthase (NADPH/NADH) small chain